jgi:hypothetical protein
MARKNVENTHIQLTGTVVSYTPSMRNIGNVVEQSSSLAAGPVAPSQVLGGGVTRYRRGDCIEAILIGIFKSSSESDEYCALRFCTDASLAISSNSGTLSEVISSTL